MSGSSAPCQHCTSRHSAGGKEGVYKYAVAYSESSHRLACSVRGRHCRAWARGSGTDNQKTEACVPAAAAAAPESIWRPEYHPPDQQATGLLSSPSPPVPAHMCEPGRLASASCAALWLSRMGRLGAPRAWALLGIPEMSSLGRDWKNCRPPSLWRQARQSEGFN